METCIEAAKFERESKAQIKLFELQHMAAVSLEEDEQRDQLDTISDVCRDIRVVNLLGGMSRRNGNKAMPTMWPPVRTPVHLSQPQK